MKLSELLTNQRIIIQLKWGDQKIEISADVIENIDNALYVTPYVHEGSVLELNITPDKGVVCVVFADNPTNGKRISWRNVELTTVRRKDSMAYCIKTYGFNNIATIDDRRLHERSFVRVDGQLYDGQSDDGIIVNVRDISDIGLSFYAPKGYFPKSSQVMITFTDSVNEKEFNVRVECSVTRSNIEDGKTVIGCKILGENRDYKLYGLLKRLNEKNQYRAKKSDSAIEISVVNEAADKEADKEADKDADKESATICISGEK